VASFHRNRIPPLGEQSREFVPEFPWLDEWLANVPDFLAVAFDVIDVENSG